MHIWKLVLLAVNFFNGSSRTDFIVDFQLSGLFARFKEILTESAKNAVQNGSKVLRNRRAVENEGIFQNGEKKNKKCKFDEINDWNIYCCQARS